MATDLNYHCIVGTPNSVESVEEAAKFVEEHGLPVIIKAAYGGGGRGMRVVKTREELEENFKRCVSNVYVKKS